VSLSPVVGVLALLLLPVGPASGASPPPSDARSVPELLRRMYCHGEKGVEHTGFSERGTPLFP
jgi:hypothetical protein